MPIPTRARTSALGGYVTGHGVIAKWLASGVLEYVAWDDRMPILLQPCGAVPKGTAPF